MSQQSAPFGQIAKLEPELLMILPKLPRCLALMNEMAKADTIEEQKKLIKQALEEMIRALD